MGVDHRGQTTRLCEIVRPTLGLITNIGPDHLEFFGGMEGSAQAKAELLGIERGTTVPEARGCAKCGESGYVGRIGVFEAVRVDDAVRRMIHDNADEATIARHAFAQAPSLLQSARALVLSGETTPEEAARVTRASEAVAEG